MGDVVAFRSTHIGPKPPFVEEEYVEPPKQRSCFDCQHALFGLSGTYCRLYHLDVWNEEQEADGCEDFSE